MPLLPQPYGRSVLGEDPLLSAMVANGGVSTFAMAALNAGWAGRFVWTGPSAYDITAIKLNWSTVSAPGQVTIRIETVDLTTGKPTGTLYDTNAVITAIVPVLGWQTYTFATAPTTHLTPGNAYAIVILTTTAGTTMTVRSHVAGSAYPIRVLTATDGTVRTNLAEVANSTPICSVVLQDGTEDTLGFFPFGVQQGRQMTGTIGVGQRITLTDDLKVSGIQIDPMNRVGTISGNLRVRIFDNTGTVVPNTTVTADKDLIPTNANRCYLWFTAVVTLTAAASPYVILCDQDDHGGTVSNALQINTATASSTALIAANKNAVTTTDATATPPTFTDILTDIAPIGLIIADGVVPSGASVISISNDTFIYASPFAPVPY